MRAQLSLASGASIAHGICQSGNGYPHSSSRVSRHYAVSYNRTYWVGDGKDVNTRKQEGPRDV